MFKKIKIEWKDVEKMVDLFVEKMAKDYYLHIEIKLDGTVCVFVGSNRRTSDERNDEQ